AARPRSPCPQRPACAARARGARSADRLHGIGEARSIVDRRRAAPRAAHVRGGLVGRREAEWSDAAAVLERPDAAVGLPQRERGGAEARGPVPRPDDDDAERWLEELLDGEREDRAADAVTAGERREQREDALRERAVAAFARAVGEVEEHARGERVGLERPVAVAERARLVGGGDVVQEAAVVVPERALHRADDVARAGEEVRPAGGLRERDAGGRGLERVGEEP